MMRNVLVIGVNLNEAESFKKIIETSYKRSEDTINIRVESLRTIFRADGLPFGTEFYLTDKALVSATDEQILMIKKIASDLRNLKVDRVYE